MSKKGLLIVVSGPSGVGKDTVVDNFLARGNNNTVLSVSATTRSPRQGEVHGESYYFLAQDEFENYIKEDKLIEYAQYGGNYYGTLRSEVEHRLGQGQNVILIIEVQGALKIKETHPEAVFVFIMPPSVKTLEQRLYCRNTEGQAEVEQRLKIASDEVKMYNNYNYVIINDNIENAVEKLESIVKAAECSPVHSPQFCEECMI